MIERYKTYVAAFLVGLFNEAPIRVAGAVSVLAVLANLFGLLCAWRRGEAISGKKILQGLTRITLYFLVFNALYAATRDSVFVHITSAIYTVIAVYEFFLLLDKAACLGIIPRGLIKKLQAHVSNRMQPKD